MKIETKNKELDLVLKQNSKAGKEFGERRLRLLITRIKALEKAESLEEVRYLPGHFHELKENRKGQWACDLDQPYRLIFEPKEKPIPTDPNGKYIWLEIKAVELIEVTNYHGK